MKQHLSALMAAILVLSSCAKEIQEVSETTPQQQALTTKLVGGSQGEIMQGNLLIRLEEGVSSVEEIEGITVIPALPVQPKNMKVAKKYGLHKWYTVEFDSKIKPEVMATRLAELKQVEAIQYSRYIEPIFEGEAIPFDMSVITKSADGVAPKKHGEFNDPYSIYQWNLKNDGTLVKGAVEGADVGVKDAWKLTAGDPSVVVAIFDCAVNSIHDDLVDALWRNEKEINGVAGQDDDGNGYIDDEFGFNFVGCLRLTSDYVNDKLEGKTKEAVKGNALNWSSRTGHGTHVAGIIGATNNNGIGVSSIAGGTGNGDGVRLMNCQLFDGSRSISDAQSAAAFIYAADNGACIAQCSYGMSNVITSDDVYINGIETDSEEIKGSPLENAALRYFLDPENSNHESLEGNMAIFAAGNHSNPYSSYPGALPYVISVTAFGVDYLPSGYTNYGPGSKIAAPGGEFLSENDRMYGILSTGVLNPAMGSSPGVSKENGRDDKDYVFMQGTSMACPHVSGVVSLGLSYAKKLGKKFTRDEFTSLLLTSVNDIDQFCTGTKMYKGGSISLDQYKGKMGTGAVDAWKFLMAIEGTPSVMVKVGEAASIDLSQWLGGSVENLKYTMSIDQKTKDALGLSADPVIKNGVLELTCTKIGAGKVTLSSSVGKDSTIEGGIGEMAFSREVSIISRPYVASNGGWF